MKEKSLVGFPLGILKRMEMPRFIKGFVKSMTASLAKLMVMAPTARSAVPSSSSESERTNELAEREERSCDCFTLLTLDESVPLSGGEVEGPVVVVGHEFDLIVEARDLGNFLQDVDAEALFKIMVNSVLIGFEDCHWMLGNVFFYLLDKYSKLKKVHSYVVRRSLVYKSLTSNLSFPSLAEVFMTKGCSMRDMTLSVMLGGRPWEKAYLSETLSPPAGVHSPTWSE